MKSDVIEVTSKGVGIETALDQTESVAVYNHLNKKQTLQLRLLVEEMMGMLQGLTGEKSADFWIEADKGTFRLNLTTSTTMNSEMRKTLLASSTSGKNVAAKGFMGKIRDIVERMLEPYDNSASSAYAAGMTYSDPAMTNAANQMWSYNQYMISLNDPDHTKKPEVWDELEKSIVGSLADDIQIGIVGDLVQMVIYKTFKDQ